MTRTRARGGRVALAALAFLSGGLPLARSPAAAQPVWEGEPAVTVRAVAARRVVRPGDQIAIAVVIEHAEGFHTWPNEPVVPEEFGEGFVPIATTIEVLALPAGAETRRIQWPEPVAVPVNYTGVDVDLLSYAGTAVAYLPLILSADQPLGETFVELAVGYQTCNETTCFFPEETTLRVPLEVVAAGTEVAVDVDEPDLFAGFDLGGFSEPTEGPGARATAATMALRPVSINAFGWRFSFDPRGAGGIVLLLLVAAIGGLVLNLTPCVLPVIPIKVMGLSRAAGEPSRLLLLGAAMSAGVVAFWVVLGGAIAFVAGFDAISSLFQMGWFSPAVGAVVGVMALGMLGAFRFRLPQAVYRIDPNHETVTGSFAFGVMAAVLSTPCTAPFMAGASAWAAAQPSGTTLATFAAIGAGMAMPYLLLAARPGWVARVPRTGPWSELVKQVIGLLMLAVAAFFIGTAVSAWLARPPEPASRAYWWVVTALVVAACGWAILRTFALTRSVGRRALVGAIAGGFAAVSLLLARGLSGHGLTDWTYYTPDRFAQAVAASRVIVLDFTAEWCLNCKALEAAVLEREAIVELLASPGVVPMRVDLTGNNPDGRAKLRELEWVGIPLLAVYGPGTGYDRPQKFDSYTAGMVREAVERARTPTSTAGG
ncbi:MAG: cytochrome c biogenesis protein CcdA [Gemmatimonadota bacterium]